MRYNRTAGIIIAMGLWMLVTLAAGHAQQSWQVTLDTSTLNGHAGFLDLQFNPGGLDALAATITVDQFVSDGSLASMATRTGGANGVLPGPPAVIIDNSTQFNDLFQGITFGNEVSFKATFSGPALSPAQLFPSAGSTFAVSLYDADGVTPLLTTSPDGSMTNINVNPDGSTAAILFADSNGVYNAKVTPVGPAVPEPGTGVSLVIGLSLIGMRLRSHRRARLLK